MVWQIRETKIPERESTKVEVYVNRSAPAWVDLECAQPKKKLSKRD